MWQPGGEKSTGEMLVLYIGLTVCGYVVATGTAIILIGLFHPESDLSPAWRSITGIINTLVGLLAGFLVGRNGNAPPRDKG